MSTTISPTMTTTMRLKPATASVIATLAARLRAALDALRTEPAPHADLRAAQLWHIDVVRERQQAALAALGSVTPRCS